MVRELGVNSQIIKLILELNKNARITVKTPFGNAPAFDTQTIVKQGTVWGPKLCCSSIGQVCDDDHVGGASVGSCVIHSSVFMDDCQRFSTEVNDVDDAHTDFVLFSTRKRSPLNPDKCVLLPINMKPPTRPPTLMIGEHKMEVVEGIKVLGDSVNSKGNNSTLITARVNTSKGVTNNMMAMCNEATFGFYRIKVLLLLYNTVFTKSMLHNSEAWSHLTKGNICDLQTSQLKALRRIMKTSSSTPKSFMFLEMGVLPIEYEIQKRLVYIHHLLCLPERDPVRELYGQLKCYPDADNWVNTVHKLLRKFGLPVEEEVIKDICETTWKEIVKKAVRGFVWKSLTTDCKSKKKTQELIFPDTWHTQEYLFSYASVVAITIFKLRGKSVNCLHNRGSSQNLQERWCRLCGVAKETQEHAVNCPKIANGGVYLNLKNIYGIVPTDNPIVRQIVTRFTLFEESVLEKSDESVLEKSDEKELKK